MSDTKNEVIVYITYSFDRWNVGARELPSSMETWGTEYGYTKEDFEKHAGGTPTRFFTINIYVYDPITEKRTLIATRYKNLPDNPSTEREYFTGGPPDCAILYRHDDQLIDIGIYGIYNTTTGEKLFSQPSLSSNILGFEPPLLFYTTGGSNTVNSINLINGLNNSDFQVVPAKNSHASRKYFLADDYVFSLKKLNCTKRTFCVNGQTYYIDNRSSFFGEGSKIQDQDGNVLIEGKQYHLAIIDALAFPRCLISHLLPK